MMRNNIAIAGVVSLINAFYQQKQYRKKRLLRRFKKTRKLLFNRLNVVFNEQLHKTILNLITIDTISPQLIGDVIRYKRIWTKERSQDHWNGIVCFQQLCSTLETELKPKNTYLQPREPLSVEKQVAIALYKLASCSEYRVVGCIFGVHKSTVKKCLYRVVAAINKIIVPVEICMPGDLEAEYIALQFEKKANIPQIIGCIDGTHIPILAPLDGYRDYVNRKGWPSYNVQAIVDHNGRFRNIVAKHPGSAHDARVFKENMVYKHSTTLIPQGTRNVDGYNIPFMLVGDPAYPLLSWLLKEHPGTVSEIEKSFNVHLGSTRVSVEMAFGRLKGRWRMLLKRMDVSYKFATYLIIACCALHNIVEKKNDTFLMHWMNEALEEEIHYKIQSYTHLKLLTWTI